MAVLVFFVFYRLFSHFLGPWLELRRRQEMGRQNVLEGKPRTTFREVCSVCNNEKGMILPEMDHYFAGIWTHAECGGTNQDTKERTRE